MLMRRSHACLLLCLLLCSGVSGQLLTPVPAFPLDTSTVTIIVDASLGNQGLFNNTDTGGVYVYTGVTTGAGNWQDIPAACVWGTPNALVKATYLGNNKYSFTIPNIRSWYNVPAGQTISKISILFWSQDGAIAQRNADASDMFVTVYSPGVAGRFVAPLEQPTFVPIPQVSNLAIGDTLPVNFETNQATSIQVYWNDSLVASTTSGDSATVRIPITKTGSYSLTGYAGNGAAYDSLNFFVSGATNFAPLPAGVQEGINYPAGDTSAILVLYAPLKHKVVVVGDFNNWTQETAYQMNETPDSNYYWLEIDHLTAGTEYAYQYVIDDTLQLADYNTEKVLDKSVDPGIPASIYPNLKPFPAGAAGTLASIIETGQTPYTWQVTNFQRPDKRTLQVYELWLADFTTQGGWQGLIDTLSYLKNLGINTVEIEPFSNFEGSNSWGYNPNFYFAPDKVYGTANDVKQFVDACHAQGMAVVMDLVMNHSFGSSPMVQMYWNNSLQIPAANSPWFNQYATHADNVGYQFNHESPATKTFTKRVIDYWLTNYHIDGYRWDLAKGFTQVNTCDAMGNNCNVAAWGNYDSSRVTIWDTIYNQMQAISPGSYCILEMFADNDEQTVEANYGMMLWGEDLSSTYNQATMGYATNPSWDLTPSIYTSLGWNNPALIVYQDSHDDERIQYNNEQYGNNSGSYNVKDTATGLARDAASTVFWAFAPGPKMITEFGELGFDYSINWCTNGTVDPSGSCRLVPKPIRWDYLQDTSRKKLHDVTAALLALKNKYPDLAYATCTYSLSGAFKTIQLAAPDLIVVAVGDFDVNASTASVTFPSAGTWYEYFTGATIAATGSAQSITLQPGQYQVFLNQNLSLTTPVTSVPNRDDSLVIEVLPNPAVQDAQVRFSVPDAGNVTLSVFTMTGQQLGSLPMGYLPPHETQVPLQQITGTNTLTPGVYWVRLSLGDRYNICPFIKY